MLILLLACAGTPAATPDPIDTAVPDTGDTGVPDTGDSAGDTGETGEDTGPSTRDADHDGYSPAEGDCDDERAHVYPGAPDYCDGLDADCDGEPIPDGSCSLEWDPTVMWSWSIEADSQTHPELGAVVGDVAGDAAPELFQLAWTADPEQHIIIPLTTPLADWPAEQRWGDGVWTDEFPTINIFSLVPIIDSTGDGPADVWVLARSGAAPGAAFVFPGREEGFGTDLTRLDQAAQAYWVDGGGVAMADDPRSGSGDMNGDGIVDLMLRTTYQKDEQLAVIFGGPDLSGTHSLAELPAMWVDLDDTEAVGGKLVGDLDGDGLAEMTLSNGEGVAFLRGEDWADGVHLSDVATVASSANARANRSELATHPPGDIDGDGLDDGYLTVGNQGGEYCAVFTTGGVPDGEVADWVYASVCNQAVARDWIDDIDDDGSRDPSFGDEVMASSRLRGGGRFEETDVVGPIIGWKPSLIDTADLDRDGYPEWLFRDEDYSPNGRTLVLKGFPIPWEEPSKW